MTGSCKRGFEALGFIKREIYIWTSLAYFQCHQKDADAWSKCCLRYFSARIRIAKSQSQF